MKLPSFKIIIFLLFIFTISTVFITKPYLIKRLETFTVLTLDKLGINTSNSESISNNSTIKKDQINVDVTTVKTRGDIKLNDGTVLAYNKPYYKLMILQDISLKDFISFSNEVKGIVKIDKEKLRNYNSLYIPFSYSLTKEDANKIDQIAFKYKNYSKKDSNGKTIYYRPIITQLSGDKRIYPKTDFLTPIIGYTHKYEKDGLTTRKGIQGVEGHFNKELNLGKDIVLNINLDNQIKLEEEVDKLKKDLDAYEVVSVVLNLDNGYVDSVASSNRYNPMSIKAKEIPFLTSTINHFLFNIDFLYEPFKETLNNDNLNKEQLLEQLVYLKGLFSDRDSDIELSFKRLTSLKIGELEKGNFKVNLIQLIKAYSIFYNDGVYKDFKLVNQKSIEQKQIISRELANEIKNTLEEFYKSIENKKVTLEFKEQKKMASIRFKYFKKNNIKYLKSYFIIE